MTGNKFSARLLTTFILTLGAATKCLPRVGRRAPSKMAMARRAKQRQVFAWLSVDMTVSAAIAAYPEAENPIPARLYAPRKSLLFWAAEREARACASVRLTINVALLGGETYDEAGMLEFVFFGFFSFTILIFIMAYWPKKPVTRAPQPSAAGDLPRPRSAARAIQGNSTATPGACHRQRRLYFGRPAEESCQRRIRRGRRADPPRL